MYRKRIIQPRALWALAQILQLRRPTAPPERIIENAKNIIEALHTVGMEIGPTDTFGPHECIHDRIDKAKRRGEKPPSQEEDLWEVMEKELVTQDWQARRPWDPPELK